MREFRRFNPSLLILAAALTSGAAAFAGDAHAQLSSTPVAVQFQGPSTPVVVPGKGDHAVTVELIARGEGPPLSGYEQALFRFLGSNADGGEVQVSPSSFVLSGNQVSGGAPTREVSIRAGPRARGPTNDDGERHAVSLRFEVRLPDETHTGEAHVVVLALHLHPEFHLSFDPPGVFIGLEEEGVVQTVEFGLLRDTSLPVEGETIQVANNLKWTPDRPSSLTQTVNVRSTTFDHEQTAVSLGFSPLEFAEEVPSSQAFSIATIGWVSVTHPPYVEGQAPAATTTIEALSLQTRKRSEEVYYAGYPSVPSDFNPHHLTIPLLPKYLWGPNPSFELELGRDFQIPVVVTPPVYPSAITLPDSAEGPVREDSVIVSTTTRDDLAEAGVDYIVLSGEEHIFQCADAGAIEGYCESLAYVRPEKAPGATVELSSGKDFFVDLAAVRVFVDDQELSRTNNLIIVPPTAEILIRAPSISLVSDDPGFRASSEIRVFRGTDGAARLAVGAGKPLQSGEEGVFRASVEMGDGSTLTVTPSTFALTAAQPEVELAIAGGDWAGWDAWQGWGTLRVVPVKPAHWRAEADPPVRLLNDEPVEFRARVITPFASALMPLNLGLSPSSPIMTTAGGDPVSVAVSLSGFDASFSPDTPAEFEVRLRSDVPDVPGGGLSITPSTFRLSTAEPRREVVLRASPRARGPLNAAGEIGPGTLVVEVFGADADGATATGVLASTVAHVVVDVRFEADFEPPELTLVTGTPGRNTKTAVLSLLQTPSQLAAGEEVTLSVFPDEVGPDPDGVLPDFNMATFSESSLTTELRLTAADDAPVQTFSLRAERSGSGSDSGSGSGGVRYARGFEPEVSPGLLRVEVRQDTLELSLSSPSPVVMTAGGDTGTFTVSLDGFNDPPLPDDPAEFEIRLRSDVPDVPGGGLVISPSVFRLSAVTTSRQVELRASPRARGPLNEADEIGPGTLTVEAFGAEPGGAPGAEVLASAAVAVAIKVRFEAAFEPPELILVTGDPRRSAKSASLMLLPGPSRLAAGEEVTLSVFPDVASPDPDGVVPDFNMATFSESSLTTELRLTAAEGAPPQTFSLRAGWAGSGEVSYASGFEPEVSSDLLRVEVREAAPLMLSLSRSSPIRTPAGGDTQTVTVSLDGFNDPPLPDDPAEFEVLLRSDVPDVPGGGLAISPPVLRLSATTPSLQVGLRASPRARGPVNAAGEIGPGTLSVEAFGAEPGGAPPGAEVLVSTLVRVVVGVRFEAAFEPPALTLTPGHPLRGAGSASLTLSPGPSQLAVGEEVVLSVSPDAESPDPDGVLRDFSVATFDESSGTTELRLTAPAAAPPQTFNLQAGWAGSGGVRYASGYEPEVSSSLLRVEVRDVTPPQLGLSFSSPAFTTTGAPMVVTTAIGASPVVTTAGGDPRTVTVSLDEFDEAFVSDGPVEFEIRLRSDVSGGASGDVPGDVLGGGLTITPSTFLLSTAEPRRDVELRASPLARGPLNAEGESGPGTLTVEAFGVGATATEVLLSTAVSVAVAVRFGAAFEPSALALVSGHPGRDAGTAVLRLLQTPSQLAAGEEATLSVFPADGSPDPDGVVPNFNMATFDESSLTTELRLTASAAAPPQTFSLRAQWSRSGTGSGSGGVRYAPGSEPEVYSDLLRVDVQDEVRLKLTISATEVQVVQGGTARITVTTDLPLREGELVTAVFTVAEESGVRFDGGSESVVEITEGKPSREIEIYSSLTARIGGVSSVVVTLRASPGLSFAPLSSPAMTVEILGTRVIGLAETAAAESATAEVALTIVPAVSAPLTLAYSLGADSDPATADADPGDYRDLDGGTVTVPAGVSSTSIRILILDDDAIEPLRETILLSLSGVPEDYVAARTTAAVTIREGVCDRTPAVAAALISATAAGDCTDVADLSSVTALAVNTAGVSVLKPLDLSGLAALRSLSLSDRVSPAGASRGLTTLSGEEFAGLSALTSLDLSLNRFEDTGLSAAVFRHLSSLTGLDLSHNHFSGANLPGDLFGHLGGLRSLRLAGSGALENVVTTLPAGIFSGLGDLRVLDLSGHRKQTADSLQVLRDLPAGIFAGLDSLTSLNLSDSEVVFRLGFERVANPSAPAASADYRLSVDLGAPYSFTVPLEVAGGTASSQITAIAAGGAHGATFTVTQVSGLPLTLNHGAPSTNPADPGNANEIRFDPAPAVVFDTRGPAVAAERLLFYSSPDSSGVYMAGSTVRIAVPFDEPVAVSGAGLELALTAAGTSRTAYYAAAATRAAGDDVLVFEYRPPAGGADRESEIRIAGDAALSLGGGQITDLQGNPPSSLSLAGARILIRAYQLVFSPAALRTVAGAESDERTLRTLTLSPLPGSSGLPVGSEVWVRVGAVAGGGNLEGVSVRGSDGGPLTGGGAGEAGGIVTFTPASSSREIRVRVEGGPEQIAGGVAAVAASFADHSGASRGDRGVRVASAVLPVGVVPLVEAPRPEGLRRFRLAFDDRPSVVLNADECLRLNLSLSGIDGAQIAGGELVRVATGYTADAGQTSVTLSHSPSGSAAEPGEVELCAAVYAPSAYGVLTATSVFTVSDGGVVPNVEIVPAKLGVRVRPLEEIATSPDRTYALEFTSRSLRVVAGESATATLALRDPHATLSASDAVRVRMTLHDGAGSVVPDTFMLSRETTTRDVRVDVERDEAFSGVGRVLAVIAEAEPAQGVLVASARLAVTSPDPALRLAFSPSTPLTLRLGGTPRTVVLQLSESEVAPLPPVGTTVSVSASLSLEGVHVSPTRVVLTAEVTAAGLTASSASVAVRADADASPRSLVLTATPDEIHRDLHLFPAALAVRVAPEQRRMRFRFTRFWNGENERAFDEDSRRGFLITGPDDSSAVFPFEYYEDNGTTATLAVSSMQAWRLDNQNRGVPSGPANIRGVALDLTGDELEEGESVTASLTWYIAEAGSAADNLVFSEDIQLGWDLAVAAGRDSNVVPYVPDDTTWVWMWESPSRFGSWGSATPQNQRLLTDLYSRQAEVVFTRDKPRVYLSMYSFHTAPPSPLALRVSVSDDQQRALDAAFRDGALGVGVRHLWSSTQELGVPQTRSVFEFAAEELCLHPGEQKSVNLQWYVSAGLAAADFNGREISPRLDWGDDASGAGPSRISVTPGTPTLRANSDSGIGWRLRAERTLTISAARDAVPGESFVLRAMPPEYNASGLSVNTIQFSIYTPGALPVCILPRQFSLSRQFDLALQPPRLSLLKGARLPAVVGFGGAFPDGDESVDVSLSVTGGAGARVEPAEVTLTADATTATFEVIADEDAPPGSLAVVASVSEVQKAALQADFRAGVLPVAVTEAWPLRRFALRLTPAEEGDSARLRWDRETTVRVSLIPADPLMSLTDDESVSVTVSSDDPGLAIRPSAGTAGPEAGSSITVSLSAANREADLVLTVARGFSGRDDPPRLRLLSASVPRRQQEELSALFTSATLEVEVVSYDLALEPARSFTLSFRDTANRGIGSLPVTAGGQQTVRLHLTPDGGFGTLSGSEQMRVDLERALGDLVELDPDHVIFGFGANEFDLAVAAGVNAPRQTLILPAEVTDERSRALNARFTPAFLEVEVIPLVEEFEVSQNRRYDLRFDPAMVERVARSTVVAGAVLTISGPPLTPGESATVTLVLNDTGTGLVTSPREFLLTSEAATSTVVTIDFSGVNNRARTATLDARVESLRVPGAEFRTEPLRISVVRLVVLDNVELRVRIFLEGALE